MSKSLSSRQALALAALLAMNASAKAAEYEVEPILSPTGGFVAPSSIATNGLVAGEVYGTTITCFKYLDGVFATLPLPPNTLRCERAVTDLLGNISMTVVPTENPNTTRVVELTTNGQFLSLNGLTVDGNRVVASKGGRMAGSSLSEAGEPQAYLFNRKGGGVNVGALTGKTRSWLTGLNAKGWAVGYAETAGSRRTQAFRYKDGKVVWLGALSEGGSTYAAGINAGGTAVGSSESIADDFMSYRAVTWKGKSGPVNLGTLFDLFTHGEAINSTGVVVGRYGLGAAGMRVSNGVMSNLVNLIPADKKVLWDGLLGRAVAISDSGMIVGANSRYNGVNGAAYLMRPSP